MEKINAYFQTREISRFDRRCVSLGVTSKAAVPEMENAHFSKTMKPETARCSYCGNIYNVDVVTFHEMECIYKRVTCEQCYNAIRVIDFESHICKQKEEEGNEEHGKDYNVDEESNSDGNEKNAVSISKGIHNLTENLKNLYLNGEYSDVTIKLEKENKEFKAHRAILGARSPVFASMLTHDMVEKSTGIVKISDCSAVGFEEFLLYLYTGTIDTLSQDNVYNLYQAADKYCIQDLKAECVEFMKSSWTVDNFCDVLGLALRYDELELIKLATVFFSQNLKTISKTVQWQLFIKENPIEANELYIKAIESLVPNKM